MSDNAKQFITLTGGLQGENGGQNGGRSMIRSKNIAKTLGLCVFGNMPWAQVVVGSNPAAPTISAQHEERVVQCIGDRSLEVIEMKSAAMSVSVFLAAAISVYGADYYVSPGNAGA